MLWQEFCIEQSYMSAAPLHLRWQHCLQDCVLPHLWQIGGLPRRLTNSKVPPSGSMMWCLRANSVQLIKQYNAPICLFLLTLRINSTMSVKWSMSSTITWQKLHTSMAVVPGWVNEYLAQQVLPWFHGCALQASSIWQWVVEVEAQRRKG